MTSPLTPRQVAAVLKYQRALRSARRAFDLLPFTECIQIINAHTVAFDELQDSLLADPEPKPAAKRGKR